jgi:hypothetical protein
MKDFLNSYYNNDVISIINTELNFPSDDVVQRQLNSASIEMTSLL